MSESEREPPYVTVTPSVAIDWDRCMALLEDSEMDDAQKQKFIETVWSIVLAFVDLGFGLYPIQQSCGQDLSLDELNGVDVVALLEVSAGEDPLHTVPVAEDRKKEISE